MTSEDSRGERERSEAIRERLEEAARYEREAIEASRSAADDSSADVEKILAETWRAEDRAASRTRWLAAAAVVLAAVGVWWLSSREPRSGGPAGVHVGGARVEILAPKGEVERFDSVRWTSPTRDPSVRFSLRVVDATNRELLLERRDLSETELSLEDVPTERWHAIEIEVEEFDGAGTSLGVAHASSRRSAH